MMNFYCGVKINVTIHHTCKSIACGNRLFFKRIFVKIGFANIHGHRL